jgi:hypothetical protein
MFGAIQRIKERNSIIIKLFSHDSRLLLLVIIAKVHRVVKGVVLILAVWRLVVVVEAMHICHFLILIYII